LHSILDEVLKNHITQIEDKKIKITKKFGKELPETIVHEEQLRFILNSILDYAITSVQPRGIIGFLTKSFDIQKGAGESKTWPQEDGRYIEILIGFTGVKKPIEKLGTLPDLLTVKQEEVIDLILRLVKDMVEKNRGMMKFEVNEKKSETYISLRLPVERRTVVYYQSINVKKII
jgi:nitrogen-specific signal transduction histidine kinase